MNTHVVSVTLAATAFVQAGYFLWKVAAGRKTSPQRPLLSLLSDGCWLSGLVATCLGWVFFVWATAIGDISFVQPLMSAGDFILVVLAVVFLEERLRLSEWFGVVLSVLGAALLSWEEVTTSATEFNGKALSFMLLGAAFAAGLCWRAQRRSRSPELPLAMLVGLAFGCGSVLTKAWTMDFSRTDAALSWDRFASPIPLAVVCTNALGLTILQIAFGHGRAAIIVPMQLAAANAVAISAGWLLFNEVITVGKSVAVLLIIAGTVSMQIRHAAPRPATVRP